MELKERRSEFIDISENLKREFGKEIEYYQQLDLVYRALCAILYNFVPTSGHPGGSISSGRIVQGLLFQTMDYDFAFPDEPKADIISYAAGHKALGLYAIWALRDEMMEICAPDYLPKDEKRLRLLDLLGFRKNPTCSLPLFKKFAAKALDGHPTPATPFLKIATGASGVGIGASFGLALAALDVYPNHPPKVHVIEGEGGMTPGRVSEALAFAGTCGLYNLFLHLDWNQSSIDSDRVCREGDQPGDYVQWNPCELCYLHDWNVIFVPEGKDFFQILAAQKEALKMKEKNNQPTAIIYRTKKGWKYGIEDRASHGAGHKFCSKGYHKALLGLKEKTGVKFPRFKDDVTSENIEKCYFKTLIVIRKILQENFLEISNLFAQKTVESAQRLYNLRLRKKRDDLLKLERIYDQAIDPKIIPPELVLEAGKSITLRGALANTLGYLNKVTGGAFFVAAADLLDSTSISGAAKDFPPGYYHCQKNLDSRILSVGGICEDAIGGVMSGISSFGNHIGIGSSYGAFIAPLQHIAARLHGIAQQARRQAFGDPYKTFIMICAHAGLQTGEDGPTHADPQCLQLLSENFPKGVLITLTPWDPQEVWPLVIAGLQARPAILAPFVTRPPVKVLDRKALGFPPPETAVKGIYPLRLATDPLLARDGTIVLQGSGETYEFIEKVLPILDDKGYNLNILYIASAELFDLLPAEEQEKIFPDKFRQEAMGITGFTLPTLYRWVTSEYGRKLSLHPFKCGHFPGSGNPQSVLKEVGLDGESQLETVLKYVKYRRGKNS